MTIFYSPPLPLHYWSLAFCRYALIICDGPSDCVWLVPNMAED